MAHAFSARAVSADRHWDSQFGPVGTSAQLFSVAVMNGKVYVGGEFIGAGNTPASYIAGYDGTNWFPLNNGLTNGATVGIGYSLTPVGTNLYVGGYFNNADNTGAKYFARWDGSNWWPVAGGNPNFVVEAVKVVGTNFFVGGAFTTNGAVTVNCITRWDGTNWQPVGTGVSSTFLPQVEAIEYDNTNLYVGGAFTTAGGGSATNVALWDGNNWHAMGASLPGPVYTLMRYGAFLYAGGAFTNSSLTITNFAKWDGATWSAVGTGANRPVRDMISDGTNLYLGGDFTNINGLAANRIVKWNGATWTALGGGIEGFGEGANPGVYKMAFDPGFRLYAAGNFTQAGSVGASHVARWDGTNWSNLGATKSKGMTHFDGAVEGLATDGTNLYAGGVFTEGGGQIANEVARFDGTNWNPLADSVPNVLPAAGPRTLCLANGSLYVGDSFTNIGGVPATRIAQFDGSSWHDIGGADSDVRALTFDGTYIWVGGTFTNIGGISAPGVALYVNGFGWFSFGSLPAGSWINAIAFDGANIYIGGNFTSVAGVSALNVAMFNGSGWVAMGAGINGTVGSLAVSNGAVYAGGSFSHAGTVTANLIAKWDGSSWTALGNGLAPSTANVAALAIIGNNLYAGGNFTNSGTLALPGIAKWDGTNWTSLGSGLYFTVSSQYGTVRALTALGNYLYVGGSFDFAGNRPSSFIARWNDQIDYYPAPRLQLTRDLMLTNRQFQFRVAGTSGETYVVQAASNLTTSAWTPLLTNSATLFDYADPNTSQNPTRMYRAFIIP
jgi:hypothetical protein